MQPAPDAHDTPFSPLKATPAGLGICWLDHRLPFQRSANGTVLLEHS